MDFCITFLDLYLSLAKRTKQTSVLSELNFTWYHFGAALFRTHMPLT